MMNPRTIPAGLFLRIVRVLETIADFRCPKCGAGPFGMGNDAGEILPDLSQRRKAIPAANSPMMRPPRGESKAGRHQRIIEEVRDRDRGCTARGIMPLSPNAPTGCQGMLQTDHQWGKAKAEEEASNLRQLCARHHDLKTRNVPSRVFWLEHFRAHCEGHGYEEEVMKCERAIALERAQHPKKVMP